MQIKVKSNSRKDLKPMIEPEDMILDLQLQLESSRKRKDTDEGEGHFHEPERCFQNVVHMVLALMGECGPSALQCL